MRTSWKSGTALATACALFGLLLAAGLGAEEPKKKKRKKKKETVEEVNPRKVLRQVDRDLLAYATEDARAGLESILDEANPGHLIALGRVLAQEKSYEEAAAQLEEACALAPASPAPWVELGELRLVTDQEGAAREAFTEAAELAAAAVEADPESFEGHYYLGTARQRLQQYAPALESLARARELEPEDPMPVYQLGLTRAFQEQWEPATELLSEALEMSSGLAYAYYYRGLSYGRMGRKDLMINDLDRFLALAPEAPEAKRAERLVQAAAR